MNIPLQEWIRKNIPKDEMIWKKPMEQQVCFVRDHLLWNFKVKDDLEREELKKTFSVISEHTSKSITLPVYTFIWRGIIFILRNNFYDWKVSVESQRGIIGVGDFGLFTPEDKIHSCYCEGFDDSWVFQSYSENNKKFTVEIGDDYNLYCFFRIISWNSDTLKETEEEYQERKDDEYFDNNYT